MLRYFEIGWRSKKDGPGNRVVIYFQGCHLRCPWCHSPHSWDLEHAPLLFHAELCSKCGFCVKSCQQGVHTMKDGVHSVNRNLCIQCGKCQSVCPNSQPDYLGGALCLPTKEKSVQELFELVKPQLLMFQSNGGVTLSGGEALLQVEEVKKFLQLCKEFNISTCVESSFTLPNKYYQLAADYVDYWLAGLRDIGFEKDKSKYDAGMEQNIHVVSSKAKKIIARYPVIQGYTTGKEKLEQYADLMKRTGLSQIELLPCNPSMLHYYYLTGRTCSLDIQKIIPDLEQYQEVCQFFIQQGFQVVKE